MYKLGKSPTIDDKGLTTMVANDNDTNMLWHQHLNHTNIGYLHHMNREENFKE
jgi:hypothetical protein